MKNSTSKTIGLATLALAMSVNAAAQVSWDKDNKIPLLETHCTIATFADFDNNGKMDIYYGGMFTERLNNHPGVWSWEPLSNLYLQQTDGSFIGDTASDECDKEPVKNDAGEVVENGHWNFISWKNGIYGNAFAIYATLDYNNDGLVDLIVNGTPQGNYFHQAKPERPFMWLYKNNGNGTFTKVEEAVFPNIYAERDGDNWNWYHQSIAVGDYDHDGYTDILVTGDLFEDESDGAKPSFCAVKLYRNVNGTGEFAEQLIANTKVTPTTNPVKDGDEVIEEGKPLPEGSFMPMRGNAAFVDLNNDGWLDIVTEGTAPDSHGHNVCYIYINEQGKSFKEVTPDTDIYPFYTLRHSAMNFADFDKDGYLDFFMTGWGDNGYDWNAFLYTNSTDDAEGFFLETPAQSKELGLDGTEGRRQVVADLNGDGYLDIHYGGDQTWPFLGNAGGTFDKTPTDFDGGQHVVFGDVTGNGLLDAFRCGWYLFGDLTRNITLESVEAPAAPTDVKAEVKDGQLVITWDYEEGVAEENGLAFNIFVQAGDKLFTLLPADPETGFLRVSQDKHTALRATVREYKMAAPAAGTDFVVGVQAISNYTETYSPFVTTDKINGVGNIKNNETEAPVYYNVQGMKVDAPKAGQVYIRKQGGKAEKFVK